MPEPAEGGCLRLRGRGRGTPATLTKFDPGAESEWGYFRGLKRIPNGRRFSQIRCGRVRRLRVEGNQAYVAAEFPAGELWGWMNIEPDTEADDYPALPIAESSGSTGGGLERAFDERCRYPALGGVPTDYQRACSSVFEKNPLQARMAAGDEFFVTRSDGVSGARCRKVRLATHEKKDSRLLHYLDDSDSIWATRQLTLTGGNLFIGTTRLHPDGTDALYASGPRTLLRAVREDGDAIGLVPLEADAEILRFDPGILRWWTRTRAECESRL